MILFLEYDFIVISDENNDFYEISSDFDDDVRENGGGKAENYVIMMIMERDESRKYLRNWLINSNRPLLIVGAPYSGKTFFAKSVSLKKNKLFFSQT